MVIDEIYKIREDESTDDYVLRVCEVGKQNRLTWQEIADIINSETGFTFSESHYRKDFKLYCRGRNEGFEEAAIRESVPLNTEPDISNIDEAELRQKYKDASAKLPYLRYIRQDSRFERFYELIGQYIKVLPAPDFLNIVEPEQATEKEYVLGLADLHIGACFQGVNNEYSIEIAKQRFEKLLGYMAKFIADHKITKLKVLSLGDVVQGLLRIADLRLNEIPVVEAFVAAQRMLADFLNKLSAYCKIEFLMVCYSNHDQLRPLGSKASELSGEDFGKILYAYLTDVLKNNERIAITGDTDHDALEFSIFDFQCKAMHGHQVNSVMTLSKDLANRDRKFYDYVFLGHTHSAKEVINAEGEHHNIQTLVLGSFIGSCPYADKLMVGSKASCSIYGFDPVYGHTETYTCILN